MVYEGKEKYIFVSYAHADSGVVLPAVEALANAGYRVWYDSGIEAGTEWPEYIEEHLANAEIVLAFMSPSAVESRNCRNEINFALELKKEVLVVYLEETTLLKGMRLQLNSSQSLFRKNHKTEESFIRELVNARILKSCREGAAEEETPATPGTPTATPNYQGSKKDNKSTFALAIIAGAALIAIAIIVAVLMSGGKKDGGNIGNDIPNTTLPAVLEMSDELFDYTLELEGKIFKLPCTYQTLTEAGWTISSSGYNDSLLLKGDGYESFNMSNNGKRILVEAYNLSGNAKAIKDCMIGEISWDADSGVEVKMAKGITVQSSVDEIIAAYGTPSSRDDYEGYISLNYQEGENYNNKIRFHCYTDEQDKKYSTVWVENVLAQESDKTETNPERPKYLDGYVAPTELGTDIKNGNISIKGDLYKLPAPMSVFMDNGWSIVQQPGAVKAGCSEMIRIERDGAKIYVYLLNADLYQTTPENCVVYKVDVESTDNVDVQLPGGISFATKKAEVAELEQQEFDVYEGTYNTNWSYSEYEPAEFDIAVRVSVETDTVSSISLSSKRAFQ